MVRIDITLAYITRGLQTITDFIQFLILQIVRGCGRFSLALEVNGKSLKEKPVEAWRSRARKLSNGHSILKFSPDLLYCLQKSLESASLSSKKPRIFR